MGKGRSAGAIEVERQGDTGVLDQKTVNGVIALSVRTRHVAKVIHSVHRGAGRSSDVDLGKFSVEVHETAGWTATRRKVRSDDLTIDVDSVCVSCECAGKVYRGELKSTVGNGLSVHRTDKRDAG